MGKEGVDIASDGANGLFELSSVRRCCAEPVDRYSPEPSGLRDKWLLRHKELLLLLLLLLKLEELLLAHPFFLLLLLLLLRLELLLHLPLLLLTHIFRLYVCEMAHGRGKNHDEPAWLPAEPAVDRD